MGLQVKSTGELLNPDTFKMKVLIYGLPGTGKTTWAATAPNPGFIAVETGEGNGLLTLADKTISYVEPTTYADVEAAVSGLLFKDKDTIVLDSASELSKAFIKDQALSIPRSGDKGESLRRSMGVPDIDDYGPMGELTRRVLRRLISLDKHIVVTTLLRVKEPRPGAGGETQIGPDLPGQMFLGSAAMFDFVLALRVRTGLREPGNPKSRFVERYFVTRPEGVLIAKCRPNFANEPLLDAEEVFDPRTGQGSFGFLRDKIVSQIREKKAQK